MKVDCSRSGLQPSDIEHCDWGRLLRKGGEEQRRRERDEEEPTD